MRMTSGVSIQPFDTAARSMADVVIGHYNR